MDNSRQKHLKIGELSKHTGISISALRYYEELGLLKPIHKDSNNYRYYSPNDIAITNFIKKAQHLGFSLKQIKSIFNEREEGKSPCPKVKEIAKNKIKELRIKIKELEEIENGIINLIINKDSESNTDPQANEICELIDQVHLSHGKI